MSFFLGNPTWRVHKVSSINEQAWLERSAQTQSNTDSFCQFNVWQEDASFTNSKYTMHTPPGENEYISVNVSLFVIYSIYTYIPEPTPSPLPQPPLVCKQQGVPLYNINCILFLNPQLNFQCLQSDNLCQITRRDFPWKVAVTVTHCVGK